MRLLDFRSSVQVLAMAVSILGAANAIAQKDVSLSGGASVGLGWIVQSSDTTSYHYSGNRLQTTGAQLLLKASFSENLKVSTGMGIVERHYPAGNIGNNAGRTFFIWSPYLVNADFKYSWWDTETNKLTLTGGYFPYSYNPDVKNLGLYLLRGPVYPGILISGFETKHTRPVSNNLGFRLQHVSGGFEQNLILNSETELYPLFDVSPAYIASMKFGDAFRIGAGVNFYHILPIESRITNPDSAAYDGSDQSFDFNGDPNSRTWTYVDTVAHDTTFLSFSGTKVMANAAFDPKAFFDAPIFGKEDLKLYGEVALIGMDMSAPYKAIYGGYMQRMPVMVGFNIPTFKLLDHLSLETEWYGAKFKDDLARYQSTTGAYHSPLPVVNKNKMNLSRDDWKWSLHGQKTIGQIRISMQAANDHSRSGGTLTSPASEWESFFVQPDDWYWMAKVGFFF
jgi:hypothetical protein